MFTRIKSSLNEWTLQAKVLPGIFAFGSINRRISEERKNSTKVILPNGRSHTILSFLGPAGIGDSNRAEILAIKGLKFIEERLLAMLVEGDL